MQYDINDSDVKEAIANVRLPISKVVYIVALATAEATSLIRVLALSNHS